MKIFVESAVNGKGYEIAAQEFQKYYCQITGVRLERTAFDEGGDVVLIGAAFVNSLAFEMEMNGEIPVSNVKAGSDEYIVKSVSGKDRKILYLAGGSVRATLYAVYHYFEQCYHCSWYWDGDVVPKSDVLFPEVDIRETPRFQYRGLRYFAHRGCKRFQAEMWGLKDWQREIDYLLKKRQNLFMLRIGQDDLFQKAFPETAAYPNEEVLDGLNYSSDDSNDYFGAQGYNDRRPFWSLKYRGELRRKLLAYAFERGLMHPEDCGTMTHWYSPTPNDFLEKKDIEFLCPTGKRTKNTLVFDIRKDSNFEYYTKLTEAHIQHYGKAEIFHAIGFAEQLFSHDREKNLRMKKYVYDRYLGYLREHYPTCPVFIAGWDLWLSYNWHEVAKLVWNLDERQCIIFDYTSDCAYEYNNFTHWGVVGKFPYVFGIFHAYESGNDSVGQYERTQERMKIAKKDDMCKGMILWPELSHSDTLMQEFAAANTWSEEIVTVENCIERIAVGRAGKYAEKMLEIWQKFLPIIKLMNWNMREHSPSWNALYYYYTPQRYLEKLKNGNAEELLDGLDYSKALQLTENAVEVLENAAALPSEAYENEMLARDIVDIVRTILGRFVHILMISEGIAIISAKDTDCPERKIGEYSTKIGQLLEALKRILSSSDDFSLYHTLVGLSEESSVYGNFEQTLKNNTVADYCRTNIYETVKELFIPEREVLQRILLSYAKDNSYKAQEEFSGEQRKILEKYMQKPLAEIDREKKYTVQQAVEYADEVFQNIKSFA